MSKLFACFHGIAFVGYCRKKNRILKTIRLLDQHANSSDISLPLTKNERDSCIKRKHVLPPSLMILNGNHRFMGKLKRS